MNTSDVSNIDSEDLTSEKYVVLTSTSGFNCSPLTPPIQAVKNNAFNDSVVFNSNDFNALSVDCNVPSDSWKRSVGGGETSNVSINDPADLHPTNQDQVQIVTSDQPATNTPNDASITIDNEIMAEMNDVRSENTDVTSVDSVTCSSVEDRNGNPARPVVEERHDGDPNGDPNDDSSIADTPDNSIGGFAGDDDWNDADDDDDPDPGGAGAGIPAGTRFHYPLCYQIPGDLK